MNTQKTYSMIEDFITGKQLPDVGAEANRQAVEKFLVQQKGYAKSDIEVDVDLVLTVGKKPYYSQIDLVVRVNDQRVMAIKCAAGSLGSREREIVSAARLLDAYQIPLSIVSNGNRAIVMDTITGKKIGEGLNAIPSREEALALIDRSSPIPFPEKKREREKLVFRTYDMENINVHRNIEQTADSLNK